MHEQPPLKIDRTFLQKSFGGDLAIEKVIYETFVTDVIPRWKHLEQQLDAGALPEVRRIVHSSKPSFTFAGLSALTPKIEVLQTRLDAAPHDLQAIKESYREITTELELLQPELENEINRINSILTGTALPENDTN